MVDFLETLPRHLPQQLEELHICVNEFILLNDNSTTNHYHQANHSTITTATPGCLCKICFRTNISGPESSWGDNARRWWEYYYQNPSYPERMILPLIRHSPQLQELVLGGYSGHAHHLVQTLLESCPDLETLDFGGSDHSIEDESLAEGMLSKLRMLRLRSHTHVGQDQNQATFSKIITRSASTLEVLWLEASDLEQGGAYLNPFCMRGVEGSGERLIFPRLKDLLIRTGKKWVYPDVIAPQHDHENEHPSESDNDHRVQRSGLGNQHLSAAFPLLKRLSLFISDAAPHDCAGCNGSLGPGRKDKAQKEFLERRRLEKQEYHRRQFASRFRQLVFSFRSCAGLKKLELHWQLCDTIREMTQEDLLEGANSDSHSSNAIENSEQEGLAVAPLMVEDLDWMDLLSLPTRAQVAKKKTSKAKARQQKEWEKEVLEVFERNMPIARYSDPLDPLYRRVGRGWQDWSSLVGRCECEFELETMRRKTGRCTELSGCGGRWRWICEEYKSRE